MDLDGKSSFSSLSVVSQDASHPSSLFFAKGQSDASLGPLASDTPVKWQAAHREFQFNSNSTPSKPTASDPLEDPARKLLRKRRVARSTLSGATPRFRSNLQESTTKLDLLDDQKLTSLPIPPPVEECRNRKVPYNLTNEAQLRIHADNRRFSVDPRRAQQSDSDDSNESRPPIVLVEDYIPDNSKRLKFAKSKVSISDLKAKVHESKLSKLPIKYRTNRLLSTTSSLTLTPHVKETDPFANMGMIEESSSLQGTDRHSARSDRTAVTDIEQILGAIMKRNDDNDRYLQSLDFEHKVKGCVICEKPLHEISSLIEGRHFREIVCSCCTLKYEETAKLLEDYEFDTSSDSINNSQDYSMGSEGSLREAQEALPMNFKRHNTGQFSSHLINRLQLQLQLQHKTGPHSDNKVVDSKTMIWFIEAKRKLRWRWGASGLLPQFLAGKRNI
ncbi:LAME_0G19394g1_1 [Lachancea meyersii CBS 8951]|uniref:LAME_0G19394g1_1 n=1 Tax=Lachancea meyersii CBS 8951 TaxID=1266667 RepID=A0A1G4KCF1_9SACH|nr:LAME_0G19394g1_1 [Lachancea meyersii CBS 8951]